MNLSRLQAAGLAGLLCCGPLSVMRSQSINIIRSTHLVAREQCVSVGFGGEAAMECGDLRVTHALPAVTTLGSTKRPTLVYNSRHVRPIPVVLADVTLPSGTLPTTVQARIVINGVSFSATSYAGSDWGAGGNTRRLAIAADTAAKVFTETTRMPFYVQVTLIGGSGGSFTSAISDMVIVNRSTSPFGAGWWLAGLEQVIPSANGQVLAWIGGDGSSRIYNKVGSIWVAQGIYRPDSITASGSGYVRWAPMKTQIRFDSLGRHVVTKNRVNDSTRFTYKTSPTRLDSIIIPVRGGTSPKYWFDYDNNYVVYKVDRIAGGTTTTTTMTRSGANVTSITDPDSRTVYYGYGSPPNGSRLETRTDARGYATHYKYDAVNRLAVDSLDMGDGTAIVWSVSPVESRGTTTALIPDSAYTTIDGPRTDSADVTRIWHGELGGPSRIRDAHGNVTTIAYSGTWPGLVTSVTSPSGFTTSASYNSTTGLMSSTTLVDPRGSGTGNATTDYTWDATWRLPTTIAPPVGDTVHMVYDGSGNLIRKQMGSTSTRRDTLFYANGQLVKVLDGLGRRVDSIRYDATLGNDSLSVSPAGYVTTVLRDGIGRDTLRVLPIASTDTVLRQRSRYDAADRVIANASAGVARPYSLTLSGLTPEFSPAAMTRTDTMSYDAEGNLLWKRSTASPSSDVNPEEHLTYDGAGRLKSRQVGSGPDSIVYDAAGNAVQMRYRSGKWITQTFDALNRVTKRVVPPDTSGQTTSCAQWETGPLTNPCQLVFPYYPTSGGTSLIIPADTATFAYDADGNMTQADNRYARTRRSYYPSGWLKTDTLKIGGYTSHSTDTYIKGQRHTYDLNGRRDSTHWDLGANKYAYHGFGPLSSVTDHGSNQYKFFFNLAGDLDSLKLGSGTNNWEKRTYNSDLQLFTRSGMITDSLYYDKMGRIVSGRSLATIGDQSRRILYDGLGAVVANESTLSGGYSVEEFSTDAFGNNIARRSRASGGVNDAVIGAAFSVVGELDSETGIATSGMCNQRDYDFSETFNYGGLLRTQGTTTTIPALCTSPGTVDHQVAMRQYYSADDKLMAVQRYSYRGASVSDGSWEEFWYDALGRRIFTRARRDLNNKPSSSAYLCIGTSRCRSFYERTWWDGDQVLIQSRTADGTSDASNSGTVGAINAIGMDRPVAIDRDGTIRVIVYDWRGLAEKSVLPNGTSDNLGTDWPARATGGTYFTPNYFGSEPTINTFAGSAVMNGQGTTGMLYRRNRYFDPASGRFTQADPIGIAGGMNVFGFAEGDPVNYSDPFGLCPPEGAWTEDCDKPLESAGALDPVLWLSGGIVGSIRTVAARFATRTAPRVANRALQNTLEALYKSSDEFSGGTAGAIRREAITGNPTKGSFHYQKGVERIANLKRILRSQDLSKAEREIAEKEMKKLQDAVDLADKLKKQ